MPDYPISDGSVALRAMGASSLSAGILVSSIGSNSKGPWYVVHTFMTVGATSFIVNVGDQNLNALLMLQADVGIGPAGSEQVVAPDLIFQGYNTGGRDLNYHYVLPVPIPNSVAVSVRVAASTVGRTARAIVTPFVGAQMNQYLGRMTSIGANASTVGGVPVDAGATANTKGAYAQLIATTTNPTRAIIVGFPNNNVGRAASDILVDIAIGAGGSEQVVVPDLHLETSSVSHITPPTVGPIDVQIPAGTRIAARASCSIATLPSRLIQVIVYGFD